MEPCGILGCPNEGASPLDVYGHLPDGLAWAADELPVEFRVYVCEPHRRAIVSASTPVTVDL